MTVFTALPDALIALWLALLTRGLTQDSGVDRTEVMIAAFGLAASAAATWFLRVVFTRTERRFSDKIAVALEAHVATLQASVATVEHHERPEYLDRLSVLRDQVFALDHLFMSLFSTLGWVLRLVFTVVLLASISPVLILLVLFAIPTVFSSTHRPAVEREVEESVASRMRLARHLFVLGTTAPPAKEVRVSGTGTKLTEQRRTAADEWYAPVAAARWTTALWQSVAWLIFGFGFVGAIVYIASARHGSVGDVILVLVAGSRLSGYIGAAVGELGFLRGIWLDSSRRLCWLEDFVAAHEEHADQPVPHHLVEGIRFEHVSFRYPGTER